EGKAKEGQALINEGTQMLAEAMTNTALIAGPSILGRARGGKVKPGLQESHPSDVKFQEWILEQRYLKDINPNLKAGTALDQVEAALVKLGKEIPVPAPGQRVVPPR